MDARATISPNWWRCPRCRSVLAAGPGHLRCDGCHAAYPLVGDIPDLRVDAPSWVDQDADRARARDLLAQASGAPLRDLIASVFRGRAGWSDAQIQRRTTEILQQPVRLAADLSGWLNGLAQAPGPFVDLGCGPGALMAAAARAGLPSVGVDVSLQWLVIARQMVIEHGGRPFLAAAMGEALPLADGSVHAVVSLDVIEHVGDPRAYLREIDRVLAPGGMCALVTPNRFSVTAEPHVSVWGVGWLPRSWQATYVRWRTGEPYEYCRLMSPGELRRLITGATRMRPRILVPQVPSDAIAAFPPPKAWLARCYNRLVAFGPFRRVIRAVCPFFQVIAYRPR